MRALIILPILVAACGPRLPPPGPTNSEFSRVEMVRDRAKFDLSCDGAQIQVQWISDTSYGAIGCGKKATYVLIKCADGYFKHACTITLDSVQQDGTTPGPTPTAS